MGLESYVHWCAVLVALQLCALHCACLLCCCSGALYLRLKLLFLPLLSFLLTAPHPLKDFRIMALCTQESRTRCLPKLAR